MATISSHNTTPAHQLGDQLQSNGISKDSSYIPAGDATVHLNYFQPPKDGSKPWNFVEKPKDGPQRNFDDLPKEVKISDIRGKETTFTLDNDAFAVVQNVPDSAESDFADDGSIKRNYYPEVEQLLLDNVLGSTKVVIFDHTIRRNTPNAHRAPVTRVHIDQTHDSTIQRVQRHCPEEAEKLLQGRYRIINVWRPLNGPVQSLPLGFASSSTLQDTDLNPIEHRYPDRTGQTAGIGYNPEHKWYYLSGMKDNERLFLECFDSEALKKGTKVQGGRVPHSAFIDPRSPEGARPRESIEVRALVFSP